MSDKHLDNLVLEDLQYKGLMIFQPINGYRFTSDAVALANYAKVKKNGVLLDLCSGSGVVGILCQAKNVVKKTYLVELQDTLAEMSKKSIEYNKLDNIEVVTNNVKGIHMHFVNKNVDTIVCNPPYYPAKGNQVCEEDEIAIAKHEVKITIEEIIEESSKILKDGGKLYMCFKSTRLAEVMYYMKKNQLEPKELKILTESKNDKVVLIKAIKRGEVGLTIQLD